VSKFHLAGIIPVQKNDLSFNFEWPDSLMPIGENLTAVERAVMECAWAGCETIWIICNDDISPVIKHRVGELVQDPVWLRALDPYPSESRKPIPIFYVPTHAKHRDKIDSLGWSIIYGSLSVFKIAIKMSRWLVPSRYYVAFPYSVYDPQILRKHRAEISNKKGFCLSYEGKTIKDGEKLGFTFNKDDFIRYRRVVRQEGVGLYKSPEEGQMPREKYPKEERYSAQFFSLEKIFRSTDVENSTVVDLPWHYPIDTWDEWANYIGSTHQGLIKRPSKLFLSYREWNRIGVDNDEDE
jgi:hypothetical protein